MAKRGKKADKKAATPKGSAKKEPDPEPEPEPEPDKEPEPSRGGRRGGRERGGSDDEEEERGRGAEAAHELVATVLQCDGLKKAGGKLGKRGLFVGVEAAGEAGETSAVTYGGARPEWESGRGCVAAPARPAVAQNPALALHPSA